MSVTFRALALVSVSVLVLACDDSPTSPGDGPIAFESIVQSSSSGFVTPRREVIRDAGEWARVWDTLYATVNPRPPRPAVDFDRHMVVLAAMGTRPDGCYKVDVTGIALRGQTLEIEVTELGPGAGCVCTQAVTQPVHLVRLDRMAMPESFRVRGRALVC